MFDRFTPEALNVMSYARHEAKNNDYVTTRHLLIALSLVESPVREALGILKISTEKLRQESTRHDSGPWWTKGSLSFTPNTKKLLEGAVEDAQIRNDDHITPSHLMRGLFKCEGSSAQEVLRKLLTLEEINDACLRIIKESANVETTEAKCEGCDEPATHADDYGVGLCEGCYEISEVPEPYQSPFTGKWV